MATPNKPDRGVPPPQQNLRTATDRAVEALRGQSAEQMVWLGAAGQGHAWRVPVLDGVLHVDTQTGTVTTPAGHDVQPQWRILVLHYLAMSARPPAQGPEVTFNALPDAMTYAKVYAGRVIGRLCATAGRDAETIIAAGKALAAVPATGGDLAMDFAFFPRLTVRLVWYAGDDELDPSAAILLPANIQSLFCIEDIVVLSESLVSRLSGRAF